MEQYRYEGWLVEGDYGEALDILFLSNGGNYGRPFVERLEDDIACKNVTVRYFITNKQVSIEEAQTEFTEQLMGKAEIEFKSHYSEITGYTWTDQEINVGGHDLLNIFQSYVGNYLILIVDVHSE